MKQYIYYDSRIRVDGTTRARTRLVCSRSRWGLAGAQRRGALCLWQQRPQRVPYGVRMRETAKTKDQLARAEALALAIADRTGSALAIIRPQCTTVALSQNILAVEH